jgi:hypothetical protein
MFSFFHPKPIGSRKAVAVLSVRQEARQEVGPHAVFVIQRTADPASAGAGAPSTKDAVETNNKPG